MRKVTTRAEAIRVAYFVAHRMAGKRVDGANATFTSKDHGRWRETEFHISHPDFDIYATRSKHTRDRRIRDSYNYVEGLLAFAVWASKHFPEYVTWREALRDPALVLATLEADERKLIKLPPRLGLGPLARAVHAASSVQAR